MWKKFWRDDAGAVVSSELLLVSSLVVGGMLPGLIALRNATKDGLNQQADLLRRAAAVDLSSLDAPPLPSAATLVPNGPTNPAAYPPVGSPPAGWPAP